MRRIARVLPGLLLVLLLWPAQGVAQEARPLEDADFAAANVSIVKSLILPLHEQFAQMAAANVAATNAYCTAEVRDFERVANAWRALMLTWQKVRLFAFGPMMEGFGPHRFQYWPDKRGTGKRQLRQVLAGQPPAMTDSVELADQSVALTDLQALEAVLFGGEAPQPGGYRCGYALAIANRQATLARELEQAWSDPEKGFAGEIEAAAEGTDLYYDAREATAEIFTAMAENLDSIVVNKLEAPMGRTMAEARPAAAENDLSGLSFADIRASLSILHALYTTPLAFADMLVITGNKALSQGIEREIDNLMEMVQAFEMPLSRAVTDPGQRPALDRFLAGVKGVRLIFHSTVARELDFGLGFNASDGD